MHTETFPVTLILPRTLTEILARTSCFAHFAASKKILATSLHGTVTHVVTSSVETVDELVEYAGEKGFRCDASTEDGSVTFDELVVCSQTGQLEKLGLSIETPGEFAYYYADDDSVVISFYFKLEVTEDHMDDEHAAYTLVTTH